jgi:hypothetical protein
MPEIDKFGGIIRKESKPAEPNTSEYEAWKKAEEERIARENEINQGEDAIVTRTPEEEQKRRDEIKKRLLKSQTN